MDDSYTEEPKGKRVANEDIVKDTHTHTHKLTENKARKKNNLSEVQK